MPCCPWYPVMLRGLSSCFSALSCWGHSGRLFLAGSLYFWDATWCYYQILSVFVQDFKRVWKVAIQASDPWTLFVLWFLSLVSLQRGVNVRTVLQNKQEELMANGFCNLFHFVSIAWRGSRCHAALQEWPVWLVPTGRSASLGHAMCCRSVVQRSQCPFISNH